MLLLSLTMDAALQKGEEYKHDKIKIKEAVIG
jgi:hypothetical protein